MKFQVVFFIAVVCATCACRCVKKIPVDCTKYVSEGCCFDGILYEKGDSWPSKKNCLKITCSGSNSTIINGCSGYFSIPKGCVSEGDDTKLYPHCCPKNKCASS